MSSFRKIPKPVVVLIALYGLEGFAANLAHPVTPSLLKNLAMPAYVFGLAFAVMQFSNFLMSPFWGNLCNYFQARKVLFVGCIGYAVGQAIFGLAQTQALILLGRIVSGAFVSATAIAAVVSLINLTTPEERKTSLPILLTSFVVMGTFGQFVGGVLGDFGIAIPFIIQVAILVFCAFAFLLTGKEFTVKERDKDKSILKQSNPIQSFIEVKNYLTPLFIMQFITVFLLSFASTSISQTFGYYIVDVLHLGSSVNGMARGVVGVISIILNTTFTIRIAKSVRAEKNVSVTIGLTILSILMMLFSPHIVGVFIGGAIFAMSFDTMVVSIMQDLSTTYASHDSQSIITGAHNSMKSLGAVTGALIAGFVYDFNALYPFALAALCYFASIITIQILLRFKAKDTLINE